MPRNDHVDRSQPDRNGFTLEDKILNRLRRLSREIAEVADDFEDRPSAPGEVTVRELRLIVRRRRMRSSYFDAELFAEPAWDMLLELLLAKVEKRQVSVGALCSAAGIPPTTALRKIGELNERGLVERHPDPADQRRINIELSAMAEMKMRAFFRAAAGSEAPLISSAAGRHRPDIADDPDCSASEVIAERRATARSAAAPPTVADVRLASPALCQAFAVPPRQLYRNGMPNALRLRENPPSLADPGSRNHQKIRGGHPMRYALSAVAVASAALAFGGPALASGNSKPQTQLTVGNCISDVVYGNEPNMANGAPGGPAEQTPGTKAGNVLPSQSPGPFVNNPNDPDNPTRGRSVGQFNQDGINIPEACRTALGR